MTNSVSDDEVRAVREEVKAFLAMRPDLQPINLAMYTTLSDTTVRSFVYDNGVRGREVVDQMKRVLAQAKAGDILLPGGSQSVAITENHSQKVRRVARQGTFYEIQTSRRIGEVLDYVAEHAAIGVITATFGAGKTESVKHWREGRGRKVECVVLEFDEFTAADKVECVRELCRRFDLPTILGSQSGGRMFRALVDHLNENPCLLIFDQCETLRPRVCQVIRQLWDRTHEAGCGVVMLAAPIFLARLAAGKMVDLGALESRVGIWAPLTGITREEFAAVVKQEGISDVDEEAFSLWYRMAAGSMRRLMRSLDLLKAKHAGKRVTERTIEGVAGHLFGVSFGKAAV
ncbi:MAG TPA: AAA family ATPase [Bryobacteraceae bacterium]|nr:AAA family ATPase [Bryobacteraceae bacterium]